jgi:gliding motility-associated-like protein
MNLNSLALSPAIGIEKQPNEINTRNITVHQALSPNGDGINDVFIIDGIENYADNRLSIMNAGGVLIYDVQGYGSNGNVFDGHSNKNSAMQKPGTYYYSLEYKDGNETKRKTGYIILKY